MSEIVITHDLTKQFGDLGSKKRVAEVLAIVQMREIGESSGPTSDS